MRAQFVAIDPDRREHVRAVENNRDLLPRPLRRHDKHLAIPTDPRGEEAPGTAGRIIRRNGAGD